MKGIALFDFDNTLYDGHSFYEYMDILVLRGVVDEETYEKVKVELLKVEKKEKSYIDGVSEMLTLIAMSLEGKEVVEVYDIIFGYLNSPQAKYFEFTRNLLDLLRRDYDLYLVTSNTQILGECVKKVFNLAGYISSEFEIFEGKFTGKISKSLVNGKQDAIELVGKYQGKSLAFGDSENDIPMLEIVTTPFCINPDEKLKQVALEKKWIICDPENIIQKVKQIL